MGLRGEERAEAGPGIPRSSCSFGSVETRERRLMVSSDNIAGNGLSSESDVAAVLTRSQR